MTFRYDSYCGLYCGACFIMNAYKQNRKEIIPEDWVSSLDDKEIKCYGCKGEYVFENCRGCRIRSCAESKGIEFCNTCPEFPCENIERFKSWNLAHHKVALHSLEIIKEIGIKEWLKQQEERWLCSNCNHPYSWFEEKCVGCGSELFNATAESKSLK